ncbi:hypothetical protein CEXT_423681, partial [Caerostris extrusa]
PSIGGSPEFMAASTWIWRFFTTGWCAGMLPNVGNCANSPVTLKLMPNTTI